MVRRVALFLGLGLSLPVAAAPRGCVGSVAVSTFRLSVQTAANATNAVAIRHLNNLPAGARISYRPIDLPADLKQNSKLTLVMVPKAAEAQVTVLEPKAAASQADWQAPFATRIA